MGASVRRAGLDDVATLTGLRKAWAEEQRGEPLEDPAFAESSPPGSSASTTSRVWS